MTDCSPAVRFLRAPSTTVLRGACVASWSSAISPNAGPRDGAKILHLVRHAQGIHNVHPDTMKSPAGLDAPLTEEGLRQCAQLARAVGSVSPDVIITSPLVRRQPSNRGPLFIASLRQNVRRCWQTRTAQTAALCFASQLKVGVPLVALESVRETVNYLCDARRPLSTIVADVQAQGGVVVDISQGCLHEHDELWASYERRHGSQEAFDRHRESADLPALALRAREAFAWLAERPEREIVVVSHSAFLWNTLNMARVGRAAGVAPVVDYGGDWELEGWLSARFENAEMRSVLCEFPAAAMPGPVAAWEK